MTCKLLPVIITCCSVGIPVCYQVKHCIVYDNDNRFDVISKLTHVLFNPKLCLVKKDGYQHTLNYLVQVIYSFLK